MPRLLIPGLFTAMVMILVLIGLVTAQPGVMMAGCCLNPLAFFFLGRATVGLVGNRRLRFE
jgi:hypothetical protein